jgi:small subunit ribosomal protein S13
MKNKKVHLFKSDKSLLQKKIGLGIKTFFLIKKKLGINTRIQFNKFKESHSNQIIKQVSKIQKLKKAYNIKRNIKFLIKIKTYKGIRHKLKYPARGQRTRTNAKTKRKFKI